MKNHRIKHWGNQNEKNRKTRKPKIRKREPRRLISQKPIFFENQELLAHMRTEAGKTQAVTHGSYQAAPKNRWSAKSRRKNSQETGKRESSKHTKIYGRKCASKASGRNVIARLEQTRRENKLMERQAFLAGRNFHTSPNEILEKCSTLTKVWAPRR